MSIFALDRPLLHIGCWLGCYMLLGLSHGYLERWLGSRFQNRRPPPFLCCWPSWSRDLAPIAALLALLSGAFVPLAPNVVIGGQSAPLHLFGNADAGVFMALALLWLTRGISSLSRRHGQSQYAAIRYAAGVALGRSLPILLLVLSILVMSSTISSYTRISFQMSELIDTQRGWNGMRWIAYLQPVALLLWFSCTTSGESDPQTVTMIPGRLSTLNYDLLTGALFFGGWQGPFVQQLPWLGLIYSALKVYILAFVRTWIAASLPRDPLDIHSQQIWAWCAPLSALNLLVAVTIVALR